MSVRKLSQAFSGGEQSPQLFGRVDLDKYQIGVALAENFEILPHGPAQNRAGFEYINAVKDSAKKTRIIDFSYNTEQTYILELGDGYIRFHTNGATLLEASQALSGITQASPGVFNVAAHGYNVGDWVYVSGAGGMLPVNGRFLIVASVPDADHFTVTDLAGTALDASGYPAYTSGGTVARVYEISSPYAEADLFDLHYVQSADVMTLVHPNYAPRELKRAGATNWTLSVITFMPSIAAPTALSVTTQSSPPSTTTYTYAVTALADTSLEESLASATAVQTNDLTASGAFNKISWTAAAGATRYNVYSLNNGLYGYIGQTADTSFTDDNITPDTTRTPPENNDPFTGAGKYPGTVGYYQQRRIFAGTNDQPQTLWMTRSGTESNLSYSIPTQDNDAINITIAARQVNVIRHIVPLDALLILTSGGEWLGSPANGGVLTPSTVVAQEQSHVGAATVQPITSENSILYVQNRGAHVRELSYDWRRAAYVPNDISLLAPHLFDGYSMTDSAYTQSPYQFFWATRSDGTLLGMSYVPVQQVRAWFHHTTNGAFESIAAVAEGNEDALYAVVKRTVNGQTVRYIERRHSRRYTTLADSFFVDAGLTYNGAATDTITGLWHLEGETVAVLADGAVDPPQVVTNGQITLQQAASQVHVGLAYNANLQTLPLSVAVEAAGQGVYKNINRVYVNLNESSSIFAGPDAASLTEAKQRTFENYGTPPTPVTGFVNLMVDPDWNAEGQVYLRQADPLPLTVVSLVTEAVFGG